MDDFQHGTSSGVSEIEPALQNTVVAAKNVQAVQTVPGNLASGDWKPPRLFLAIWRPSDKNLFTSCGVSEIEPALYVAAIAGPGVDGAKEVSRRPSGKAAADGVS